MMSLPLTSLILMFAFVFPLCGQQTGFYIEDSEIFARRPRSPDRRLTVDIAR